MSLYKILILCFNICFDTERTKHYIVEETLIKYNNVYIFIAKLKENTNYTKLKYQKLYIC